MKFIFSLLVAVIVGSFSCSAADLDSVDYYSLSPVQSLSPTVNSALDYSVQPLDLSSDESNWLMGIWQGVTQTSTLNGGSLLYNIQQLRTSFSSFAGMNFWDYVMDDIEDIRVELSEDYSYTFRSLISDIRDALLGSSGSLSQPSTHSIFYYIYNLAALPEIKSDTQNIENNTNYLDDIWGDTQGILTRVGDVYNIISSLYARFYYSDWNFTAYLRDGSYRTVTSNFDTLFSQLYVNLAYDAVGPYTSYPTLYSRVMQLQEVLASDDDLALANSQKFNREEIESSFLTGSSGSTSLGVSDFGDLADVGGTIKDSLSLDGNATIGSFTSGLAAADSVGQGWFSEETRSQLDAVSSTVTYSLRDSDPYNMAGWEDRYYWLLGDDE